MLDVYFKTSWLRWLLGALGVLGTSLEFEAIFIRDWSWTEQNFISIFGYTTLVLVLLGAILLVCLPTALYRRRYRTAFGIVLQMCFAGGMFLIESFLLAILGGSVGGH